MQEEEKTKKTILILGVMYSFSSLFQCVFMFSRETNKSTCEYSVLLVLMICGMYVKAADFTVPASEGRPPSVLLLREP